MASVVIRIRREPDHSCAVVGGRRPASGRASDDDRVAVDCLRAYGQPPVMSKLLNLASQLLTDWPNVFLAFCQANNFGYTEVGRFNRTLPYWFYRVVYEQLSRGRYCYTKQEFDSIIDYLQRKNGYAPTRQEVLPYLSDGLRDIRFGAWGLTRTIGKKRECPYCQKTTIYRKAGFVPTNGKPRFKCTQCQRSYTLNSTQVVHTKEERSTAFQLYAEGHTISDIARRLAVSRTAVRNWIKAHQASESPSV